MIEDQCWVKAWVSNRKSDVKSLDTGLRKGPWQVLCFDLFCFYFVCCSFVSDRNDINTVMKMSRAKINPEQKGNLRSLRFGCCLGLRKGLALHPG